MEVSTPQAPPTHTQRLGNRVLFSGWLKQTVNSLGSLGFFFFSGRHFKGVRVPLGVQPWAIQHYASVCSNLHGPRLRPSLEESSEELFKESLSFVSEGTSSVFSMGLCVCMPTWKWHSPVWFCSWITSLRNLAWTPVYIKHPTLHPITLFTEFWL